MELKKKIDESPLVIGGSIIALAVIIGIVMGILGAWLFGIAIIVIVAFLSLYLILAPSGIFAFLEEEGYAKIIMKGESFYDVHIKMRGKYLSTDLDIVDEGSGKPRKKVPFSIFGMVFIAWPFYRVYTYEQEWVKFKDGVKEKRKEVLDHVLGMPYVYGVEVLSAETKGKIPINLKIEVEAEIFAPYKAMFRIKNWNSSMTSWIEGATRDFISTLTYEEIQDRSSAKPLSEALQEHINNKVKRSLENYGVRINNLTVIDIDPADKEYEEDTKVKTREERKKEAAIVKAEADAEVTIIKAEADAKKEAISRMSSALIMVASATGQTIEDLKKEIQGNPGILHTKYKNEFDAAMSLVNNNMAIDGKAYFKLDVPSSGSSGGSGGGGGSNFNDMIVAIIAATKIIDQQKEGSASNKHPLKEESRSNPKREKFSKQDEEDFLSGKWIEYDDED